MIWSSMAQKWPIIVIFCGMDNQKSKFLLIHGIFSVRGCWGQSRLLFWKLDDESQISKTQDHTDTFKHNLTSIFLSVRPKLLLTFQYEIPCKSIFSGFKPRMACWILWTSILTFVNTSVLFPFQGEQHGSKIRKKYFGALQK